MSLSQVKVAFYGPVSQGSGYGIAARAYVHALHDAGVDLSVVDLQLFGPEILPDDRLVCSLLNRRIDADFHIIHYFIPAVAKLLTMFMEKVIVVTTWEADTLPSGWASILNKVREVWVPCEYNLSLFRNQLSVPVFKWPHAIWNLSCVATQDLGVSEVREHDFVFYSIFRWQNRKNPEAIIYAFLQAFDQDEDVVLVLKILADQGSTEPERVLSEARTKTCSRGRVLIISEEWSDQQLQGLMDRGDCYVSLHRSEGWCYPLFEAACRGKAIVATAYSGPLDYLDPRAHSLVNWRPAQVATPDTWFRAPMMWAEPDREHASCLMREIYGHRQSIPSRTKLVANRLRIQYSSEVIGRLARERLEQLMLVT